MSSFYSVHTIRHAAACARAANVEERKRKFGSFSKQKKKQKTKNIFLAKSKGQATKLKGAVEGRGDRCGRRVLSGPAEADGFPLLPDFGDTEQRTVAATVNMRCRFNLGSN